MMKSPGQIAFEAYGAAAEWKTFDGRAMPQWEDAAPHMVETRRRWEVAARAVLNVQAGVSAVSAALDAAEG